MLTQILAAILVGAGFGQLLGQGLAQRVVASRHLDQLLAKRLGQVLGQCVALA